MMKLKCSQYARGFIMIELLIGIVVLIGLMSWWMEIEQVHYHKQLAKRLCNEINLILNAATSYYIYENNHWPPDIETLVKDKYLSQQRKGDNHLYNPFGQVYKISLKNIETNHSVDLNLTTKIPHDNRYVARFAMGSLPFAKLSSQPTQGYDTLTISLIEPGITKTLSDVVRFSTIVSSGALIPKPICNREKHFFPAVYPSVASCGDLNGILFLHAEFMQPIMMLNIGRYLCEF